MKSLQGCGVALITPFNKDLSIDFPGLEKLVNHVIENGVDYLVVLGTTAESATLNATEKLEVINCITKANAGKVPMVLGIGGNNTMAVSDTILSSDLQNFEAILSVSPYYNKPTQEGIYQHFKYIAERTDSQIILYNVPSRTASNMESETTLRLAHDFENIVAIKEASPNFNQSISIIKDKPDHFAVISGDDEYTTPMTLAGGSGVISVIGQAMTEPFCAMVQSALNQNVEQAYYFHYQLLEITRAIYKEGNPAGIKALLSLLGICQPYTRLPLVPASEKLTKELKHLLKTKIALD